MIPFLVRVLKRLVVLGIGVGAVYVSVWKIFPFLDNRLRIPEAAALLATYILMAYVILPAVIRGVRFFWRPKHIPHYSVTPDGFASDPVNIGLIGTRRQVILAMEAAGWQLADRKTLHTIARHAYAIFFHRSYPTAPMSSLYLFGRKQDLGFEIELRNGRGQRHHVRFWACEVETPDEFLHHVSFWRRIYRPHPLSPARQLWVGAASKDVGLAPIRHNAQLTHMIDPDTNAERELIVKNLRAAGKVTGTQTIVVGRPYRLSNRAFRGFLLSDGKMKICELR